MHLLRAYLITDRLASQTPALPFCVGNQVHRTRHHQIDVERRPGRQGAIHRRVDVQQAIAGGDAGAESVLQFTHGLRQREPVTSVCVFQPGTAMIQAGIQRRMASILASKETQSVHKRMGRPPRVAAIPIDLIQRRGKKHWHPLLRSHSHSRLQHGIRIGADRQ